MAHYRLQTVVELPSYLRSAEAIFNEEERDEIVARLAADPSCGDIIPGTGGFRKVRAARGGMGKRGGARVLYIFRSDRYPVFLIAAYAKSVTVNLTKKESNELAKRSNEIFDSYRSTAK